VLRRERVIIKLKRGKPIRFAPWSHCYFSIDFPRKVGAEFIEEMLRRLTAQAGDS
jgi:hypothetical protein